jgi:transcriptional regulator with XRE-family HTH domain
MESLEKDRARVAKKVQELRKARRWTQAELARHLKLSQSRLSEIEGGGGSFTAEQFLLLLRLFNVGVSAFVSERPEVGEELQNALARLGASHLQEAPDVLPSEHLEEAFDVIREAIVSGSPRHITGLAPVLVRTIDRLDVHRLRGELSRLGLGRRFQWILENTAEALHAELASSPPRAWAQRYRRALVAIEPIVGLATPEDYAPVDLLDATIRSKQSLAETVETGSALSKKWRVASRLRTEDFAEALRTARD